MNSAVLSQRFSEYAARFQQPDGSFAFGIRTKIDHTKDVCRITDTLVAGERTFSPHEAELFAAAALFHDVSRFEQYQNFHTFRDDKSFDHGEKSAKLIQTENFLSGFYHADIAIVTDAVRVHNRLTIPATLPAASLPAAKMVRDADKLAILELLIAFFNGPEEIRSQEINKLDMPDTPGWSDDVLADAAAGRPVRHAAMRNVNDFKLILFSWAHDLNYRSAAIYALDHALYPAVRRLLPASDALDALLAQTLNFLQRRISG